MDQPGGSALPRRVAEHGLAKEERWDGAAEGREGGAALRSIT